MSAARGSGTTALTAMEGEGEVRLLSAIIYIHERNIYTCISFIYMNVIAQMSERRLYGILCPLQTIIYFGFSFTYIVHLCTHIHIIHKH